MIIANNSDSLHYTLSSEATSAISKESYDKILYYSLDLLVNKKNYKKGMLWNNFTTNTETKTDHD